MLRLQSHRKQTRRDYVNARKSQRLNCSAGRASSGSPIAPGSPPAKLPLITKSSRYREVLRSCTASVARPDFRCDPSPCAQDQSYSAHHIVNNECLFRLDGVPDKEMSGLSSVLLPCRVNPPRAKLRCACQSCRSLSSTRQPCRPKVHAH